jgi:hypothetical protein
MYTSGRTVKSKARKVSPLAEATKTARLLVRRHLMFSPAPATIASDRAYATDLTERIRTVITFPEGTDARALADAIEALPRYRSMTWNSCSISYLTDLEG